MKSLGVKVSNPLPPSTTRTMCGVELLAAHHLERVHGTSCHANLPRNGGIPGPRQGGSELTRQRGLVLGNQDLHASALFIAYGAEPRLNVEAGSIPRAGLLT